MRWWLLACLGGCGFSRHEVPPAPRLIAPLSTSFVNTGLVNLRFALPPTLQSPRVELSRHRDFTAVVAGVVAGDGTSAVPETPLDRGRWYWRVLADSPMGPASSAVWQLQVTGMAARQTVWGSSLDVDGDGFDELAVGVPGANVFTQGQEDGRVRIYRGGPGGPEATRVTVLDPPMGAGEFGFALATVDWNGDGYADLAVGAPGDRGAVYIYFGGPDGLPSQPNVTLQLDRSGSFGWAIDSAGDFNGDGFGDLVIGAPTTQVKLQTTGAAYVFQGAAEADGVFVTFTPESANLSQVGLAVAGGGDLDGDGLSDIALGAPGASPGGHAWVFHGGFSDSPVLVDPGAPAHAQLGSSLLFRGDLDGDGFCELAVGAPEDGPGRVHLYAGRTDPAPAYAGSLDGISDGSRFGGSLASGDADGDGRLDLAVAAPCNLVGGACVGTLYVYAASTVTLDGPSGTQYGIGLAFGDLNGDGKADLAASASELVNDLGRVDWYPGPPATPTILNGSDARGRFGYAIR